MKSRTEILERTAKCNVAYHVLGETDRSAMPIGNGELAASVWVDKNQDICFYLSRTDALTELDRTVKLGMFRIKIRPGQWECPSFEQKLSLTEGKIHFQAENGEADIWIDSRLDVCCVQGTFENDVTVDVEYVNWRDRDYAGIGALAPEAGIKESKDIIEERENGILFYHKNGASLIPYTAKLEGVGDYEDEIPDLLKGRIFGGMTELGRSGNSFTLKIATYSAQTEKKEFEKHLQKMQSELSDVAASMERTAADWAEYWTKSYIFVENDKKVENHYMEELEQFRKEPMEFTCEEESMVTRAYVLTKFMNACCNDGNFPVLYNGMLFNLCPGGNKNFDIGHFGQVFTDQPGEFSIECNPDERSWCIEHLWQNVRHPYYSLLERGEGEKLKNLFGYYRRFWDLNRRRARIYYQAEGQHNTEMTLSCGLQTPGIYGYDRTDKPIGYSQNRWGGAVDISPGLELANLMLDYYDFYKDDEFLRENQIYMKDLLRYVETRFPEMENGKMQIGPVNSVETYWDTINPIPIVAGIARILQRILAIGEEKITDIDYYRAYLEKLPEIPYGTEDGEAILLPAEKYEEVRNNVEIPELYACYPFRNYTFYREKKEVAVHTFLTRIRQYNLEKCFRIGQRPSEPSYSGWQYIGVVASLLGLTDRAEEILVNNCSLSNPGTRFPAMWGPIYDAAPDTDHGANILKQLQMMVMQADGNDIYVLPAFPENWNVEFRLYADAETEVSGVYRNGVLEECIVTPDERKKDSRIVCGSGNTEQEER